MNTVASESSRFIECLLDIENTIGIDKRILLAIKTIESGNRLDPIIRKNKNATMDIGIMQINSIWLPELQNYGINTELLLDNCINLRVAASILYRHYQKSGDIWHAVGQYHSSTPHHHQAYREKVYTAYHRILTSY